MFCPGVITECFMFQSKVRLVNYLAYGRQMASESAGSLSTAIFSSLCSRPTLQ